MIVPTARRLRLGQDSAIGRSPCCNRAEVGHHQLYDSVQVAGQIDVAFKSHEKRVAVDAGDEVVQVPKIQLDGTRVWRIGTGCDFFLW